MNSQSNRYVHRLIKSYVSNGNYFWRQLDDILQPKVRATLYSTGTPKYYFNVLDLFVDMLRFDKSRYQKTNGTKGLPTALPTVTSRQQDDDLEKTLEILRISKAECAFAIIRDELERSLTSKKYNKALKLLEFYADKNIDVSKIDIKKLARLFSSEGFVDGLKFVRHLYGTRSPEDYQNDGELLLHMAKCYWVAHNVHECVGHIRECANKYSHLNDIAKTLTESIINEAVTKRSEVELRCIVDFVQMFSRQINDFYLLSVLWNHLFLSELFTDQSLANTIITENEELRYCIALTSSSLTRYLIINDRIQDVYRFMQVLLKNKMADSYASVSEIMFDHFFSKRDVRKCSEIVKASVRLNIPLRDEQYNLYISWCVSGDPYKFVSKTEIAKIYSKF